MKVHGWATSVREDSGDMTSASWARKELNNKEAATTALILSLYTSMLTYIVVVYAHAFRGGFILAFKIAGGAGGFIFLTAFLYYATNGRRIRIDVNHSQSLKTLRSVLSPLEAAAADLLYGDSQWLTASHIRLRGNGVSIDLHELDVATANSLLTLLIATHSRVGRVQLITGRGRPDSQNPQMRGAVIDWLQNSAAEKYWIFMKKKHAVTLRPRSPPIPPREMVLRVLSFGLPLGALGAVAFADVSNGIPGSQLVGFIAGFFLAWMLSTHSM